MPGPTRLFLLSQMGRKHGAPLSPVAPDGGAADGLSVLPPSAEVQEESALRARLFSTLDSIMEGLGVDAQLAAEIRQRLEAAAASGRAIAEIRPYLGELRKRSPELANEVGIRFAHHIAAKSMSKAMQPPPGFQPVQGSKSGGYYKEVGGKRVYWYPDGGVQHSARGGDAEATQPGAAPPEAGAPRPPAAQQPPGGKPGAPGDPAAQPGGEHEAPPQKPGINDLLGGNDPDHFNKEMGLMERAKATADWDVTRTELDQYGPRSPYASDSFADVRTGAAAHIRDLVAAGVFPPSEVYRVADLSNDMLTLGKEVGIAPDAIAGLVRGNIEKLALQEVKAGERTIGDHGIRHLSVNVVQGKKILSALGASGQKISALDRMMLTQVMIDHDMGYTIPAIHEGGFKVSDKFHPQASRVLWDRQGDMSRIFGSANFAKMGEMIEAHSGSGMDWGGDPLGSTVRLADNTHLFADKMPDLLYNKPKGAELMAKIALAKGAFGISLGKKGLKAAGKSAELQEVIGALRDAMKAHIDGRADIPPNYRARLSKAANEISHVSEVFLASRLAGRSPNFTFSGGQMRVTVEQSDARKAIGEVFGADEQDKQFLKMLVDDFHVPKDQVEGVGTPPPAKSIEVPPKGKRDGKAQAIFTWQPGKKSDPTETALATQLGKLQGEFKSIMRSGSPEARQKRLLAWAGDLKKSLLALLPDRLQKAGSPGPGWQTIPGGRKGGWRKPNGKGGWEYKYDDAKGGGKPKVEGSAKAPEGDMGGGLDSAAFLSWFGDWRAREKAVASQVVDPKTGRPAPIAPDPKLSKTMAPDGKPMVVFHGSKVQFRSFDPSKVRESGEAGPGFYFSTDPGYAETFQKQGGNVFKVYLNIKKPFDEEYGGLSGEALAKSLPPSPFRDKALKDPKRYWGYKDMLGDVFDSFQELRGDSGKSAWRIVRDQMEAAGFDGIRRPEHGHWVAFDPSQIKAVNNEGSFDSSVIDIYKSAAPQWTPFADAGLS